MLWASLNWKDSRGGGTLGISGWGCAARTLEPLAYTRASFSWILLPYTRVNSPNHRFPSEFRFLTVNNMYLLTEWEGRTGKYLARGHGVRTERSEVRAPWPRAKYFPVRPDLTQSISILSYDHRAFPFFFFFFGKQNSLSECSPTSLILAETFGFK